MPARARSLCVAVLALSFLAVGGTTASASVTNGRIVYQGTDGFLYSAAADGTDSLPLWTSGASPAWSPDGTRIAFLHPGTDGLAKVWVMNADGSGKRQLTSDDGTGYEALRLSWSPDDAKIAFTSTRGGDGLGIWIVNADGSGLHEWNGPEGANPSWSPDGTRIAFERAGAGGAGAIFVAGADGSDVQQLTVPPTGASDGFPAWSPDGSTIAFLRGGGGTSDIYAVGADGSGLRQLTTSGDAIDPAWSPDGTKLVFAGECSAGCSPFLYEMNADGSNATLLRRTAGFLFPVIGATPSWGSSTVAPQADTAPPVIDVQAPADGATYGLGSTVSASYTCSDDVSGVATCSGTRPSGSALDTSQAGTFTFQVTATDNAGHTTSRLISYSVGDRTPPTVSIAVPDANAAYLLGSTVTADYSCADELGGSGIAGCQATAVDTSSVGQKTFTVTASDNAGNVTSASRSYTVVYAFSGFSNPTAVYPNPTSADAGQSVRLRFSLRGDQGLDVLAAGSPSWTPCAGGTATPATGALAYQASLDRYAYEAQTPKSWAGTCEDLTLTLKDGTTHTARFQFDK